MKRNIFLIFLICSNFLFLAGCWDSRELQKLSIISGIAIDKDDSAENRYLATIQIINPSQVSGGEQGGKVQATPVRTFSGSGSTLAEALRKISPMAPGQLFYPHIQVMILSEEVATEGIQNLFDLIERDSNFRLLFPVLIAKDTPAKNILQVTTSLNPIPSDSIVDNLETSQSEWGEYISVHADQLIEELKGGNFVVSGVQIKGEKEQGNKGENIQQISPAASIEIGGLSLFKDGKLENWLEQNEARGTTWIMDEMKKTILTLDSDEKKNAIAIEVNRAQTTIKIKIKKNQPIINIFVNAEGTISETLVPVDLSHSAKIEQLEKQMEKEIKKEIQLTVELAQKEKSDFLGFDEYVNIKDKKLWKKIADTWDEEVFPEVQVNINVDAYIRRTGMRMNPSSK
ncbi:Ger(x)C family spore germination protein [Niallia sp. NCCP-28]|uniref:Ger(x)C family spore germination protein n=1 Tax=Niallia sp. NCCP-28 TaxID=2934712 RepID=UPI00208D96E0|nr:Ger(x)C family spore germination protein [Niallia sp. NCCP-28]GKU83517.1 spore germination protein KC [Niallia sp. NCCP-28]